MNSNFVRLMVFFLFLVAGDVKVRADEYPFGYKMQEDRVPTRATASVETVTDEDKALHRLYPGGQDERPLEVQRALPRFQIEKKTETDT